MSRFVEMRERKSRRKQEPRMSMRIHRCWSGCECDEQVADKGEKWVQLVGVDEEAEKMKLSFQ
eukprot:9636771-Karenia_brevis.AAC.1